MINQVTKQPVKNEPRFFYGYIVVVAAFFIMVVSWATYHSFGIFFKPLLDEFSWNRATISGAFSLSLFMYGVLGIAARRNLDAEHLGYARAGDIGVKDAHLITLTLQRNGDKPRY